MKKEKVMRQAKKTITYTNTTLYNNKKKWNKLNKIKLQNNKRKKMSLVMIYNKKMQKI